MPAQDRSLLRIGDGGGWHFVNHAWEDGPDGLIAVPEPLRRGDGSGLQGHHYAFCTRLAGRDVLVRFAFRLTGHSDAGIILRAADEAHFYLVHFPSCGQASRAQHFWVAFSKMDGTGYLKCVKMDLVRRVPSNSRLWLTADVSLIGSRLTVRVGEHGLFEAEDCSYPTAGAIGVFTVGGADLRQVKVLSLLDRGFAWDASVRQPTNWFHPCPKTPALWQKPSDLVRLPDGELLLAYSEQDPPYSGPSTHWVTRSRDGGRTWSPPVNVDRAAFPVDAEPLEGNLDLTEVCSAEMRRDGHLMALVRPVYSPWMWETWSKDGGATWSPCVRGPFPGYATPNMLRTASGAVLVSHRLPSMTVHCSLDDGHTWDSGTLIDGAIWVMGGMVEVEPDLVLYVYWDSHEALMRAQFIRVTREGLVPSAVSGSAIGRSDRA